MKNQPKSEAKERKMSQEQKWLSYVAELREKHNKELMLFKEDKLCLDILTIKLKEKDLDIQKLKGENEQLLEQISTLQGQFIDQDIELSTFREQWQPSKQEQIDELQDKFDALDDEYQELVKFSTIIFRGIPRFELTALMSPEEFEKFKNHIGV